jgi:two-component system, LytTR family, response regulator
MNTIKCLIVDDEPIACEIIESFISNINFLELSGVSEDPFQAMKILENKPVDLLISDIDMPGVNGLELVRSLPSPPLIIFITAHEQFAVDSFELGVVDYLLKPVRFDRFLKAVEKARLQIDKTTKETSDLKNKNNDSIFIKVGDKESKKDNLINLKYSDILYIKANNDYLEIHTSTANILTYSTIKAIQEKLRPNYFFRIHNSHLVSIAAIKLIKANMVVLINGEELQISKRHKAELLNSLNINR